MTGIGGISKASREQLARVLRDSRETITVEQAATSLGISSNRGVQETYPMGTARMGIEESDVASTCPCRWNPALPKLRLKIPGLLRTNSTRPAIWEDGPPQSIGILQSRFSVL